MYNVFMNVILASASPRRRQLIVQTGVDFTVIPSGADENADETLPPNAYAEALATKKAEYVAASNAGVVLGADTIVVLDGKVIGKPSSLENARKTLAMLSGRKHTVITGFCVIYGASHQKRRVGSVCSDVYFNILSKELIDEYTATGKCMDKAGSYGVQDGFPLVEHIEGSLSNVIGLPVEVLTGIFKEIENE